jgi:hypothetical protein
VAQGTLIPASADIQGGTYHAYHRNDSRRRSYHLAPHLGRAEADPAGQGLAEQRGSGLSDPHANAGPDPADAHTVSDAGSAHAVPDAGATDTVSDPGSAHAVPDDRTGHPDRDDNRSSPAHSGASNADHRTRGPGARFRLIGLNTWFHRVFNERLFNAANNWGGADSWFLTWALGPNSGGAWTSHGNSGEVVYRGTSTHIQWCLGLTTSSQYKNQFMAGAGGNAAVNVRIAPNSVVTVQTAGGKTIQQATSDAGDITIILPDTGTVVILVDYTTAAPTHESLVWVGPYDRSDHINTVDGR